MTPQFDHHATNSFFLWADHILLEKASAYKNISVPLYPMGKDREWKDLYAYSSPFKQWNADSSISGANIPSGVTINSGFQPFSGLNVIVDYQNGRILSETPISGSLSMDVSVKDINIYVPNEDEEDIIFENRYENNSRFQIAASGVNPYEPALPAVFFSIQAGHNEEFSFGGEEQSEVLVKGVVMVDDLFTLEGVLSTYKDTARSTFNLIPFERSPYNEFYDLKDGTYSYKELNDEYGDTVFYIDRVVTSKLSDRTKNRSAKNMFVGFVDFTIKAVRYPRA